MKVLHVSDTDLASRRFAGFDLIHDLASRGIDSRQAVLQKKSKSRDVTGLLAPGDGILQRLLADTERAHSLNNLLVPWGRLLADTKEFAEADLVHYHLIHNQVISLYDLKWLFGLKRSVWTFHDPWPLTGHCIHPMGCDGWTKGCAPCPFLDRRFPIAEDRADRLWRGKQRIFRGLDADIVVASPWMLDMVRSSPLTSHLQRVHLVPFGIKARHNEASDHKATSRRRLRIPIDDYVILIRASTWDAKGTRHAMDALAARPAIRPTTVLVIDERGLTRQLYGEYRVRELGWVDGDQLYDTVLPASDVLLMPSLAESFGLLAVETMAAGRAVICYEGTALPAITHAPDCGLAVPMGDTLALRAAIDHLATNRDEADRRGRAGRAIVEREYAHEQYLDRLETLYNAVVARERPAIGGTASSPP